VALGKPVQGLAAEILLRHLALELNQPRCLAMGFLLESPVQIVRFSQLHLSTRRGALQSASKG
jgi:hypothetical protein